MASQSARVAVTECTDWNAETADVKFPTVLEPASLRLGLQQLCYVVWVGFLVYGQLPSLLNPQRGGGGRKRQRGKERGE